jgi:hypothetical protein
VKIKKKQQQQTAIISTYVNKNVFATQVLSSNLKKIFLARNVCVSVCVCVCVCEKCFLQQKFDFFFLLSACNLFGWALFLMNTGKQSKS